jgi:starch synthase
MRVALATIGKFHTFDLARQLLRYDALAVILSGYPRFKLKDFGIPEERLKTFPWVHAPLMRLPSATPETIRRAVQRLDSETMDYFTKYSLPPCDIFHWLSGAHIRTARSAREKGSILIVDRGSTHIVHQDLILREEYDRLKIPFGGVDKAAIRRELAEYQIADAITVPSRAARSTFIAQGVAATKVKLIPYGVDITRFTPQQRPGISQFEVLFVGGLSVRKGLSYLFEAFDNVDHPAKHLHLVGAESADYESVLGRYRGRPDITFYGHLNQPELNRRMSRSTVMVLPSIEEGLALVQAQAMASGCPVIATTATGAEDLFSDGVEGYIVPPRDVEALAGRLQQIADTPGLADSLGEAARTRVTQLGGWNAYGDQMMQLYESLLADSA